MTALEIPVLILAVMPALLMYILLQPVGAAMEGTSAAAALRFGLPSMFALVAVFVVVAHALLVLLVLLRSESDLSLSFTYRVSRMAWRRIYAETTHLVTLGALMVCAAALGGAMVASGAYVAQWFELGEHGVTTVLLWNALLIAALTLLVGAEALMQWAEKVEATTRAHVALLGSLQTLDAEGVP
ncbi:MAG: hypothetical protein R3C68_11955 [Myxococcota bacterium]